MSEKEKKQRKTVIGRFKSIRTAMLFSFTLIILVALSIFLIIALTYTENTVMDNAVSNTSKIIGQVNYDIDSYIDYMENISSVVVNNEDVQTVLFEDEASGVKRVAAEERVISQFRTIIDSRDDIYNIAAVRNMDHYVVNDGYTSLNSHVDIASQDWYQKAMESDTGISLSPSHVQNAITSSYKWVITLSRVITNQTTNVREGLFFIDLNYSAISNLCNNNKIGNKGYLYILDENGNLIYHPQQQLIYGGLKTERVDEVLECKNDHFIVSDDNDSKLYTISTSEKTGWTVVGVAYNSELLKNNKQTQLLYVLVALVLLAAVVILSSIISKGITKPVEDLRDSMEKVEQGEFDKASVAITTNNEIGSLSKSFNLMTDRIQNLMEQNVYEQEQKRKSEMKALQSQINPHFLYNTLDSIIWMAEGKKNEEVVLMTSSLARLLRQSISNEDELVPIRQEIDYVKSYLTIQKMRYKDKLEFQIEVDPEVEWNPIVKLVLQPIVENAIYHGLKYKETKGMLTINVTKDTQKIYIRIHDDGVGMNQDTLDHIFDHHKVNYKSNGVGIYNVQQRLQLHYGEEYGISYESRELEGTTATIIIPLNKGGDGDENE
ncbi:MAG: sensor histidine kinase [Lachnospiraceae bacterium]|nr:sensor histidine kinase [Lachnospiraceae bacterium]